jgi:hypothetical protein
MGGSIANAVAGPMVAGRANRNSKRALNQGNVSSDLLQLENLFLPYDQLVAMGRIAPNSYSQLDPNGIDPMTGMLNSTVHPNGIERAGTRGFEGLSGNQSRVGRNITAFEQMLGQADPVMGQYQQLMANSLKGMNDGGLGLPADFQRNLTNTLRSAQSSRGLLDSDTSAIQETATLMGGSEMIRSSRLNEVQNYLNGVTSNALSFMLPNMSQLYGGELQRAMQGSQNALGAAKVGVDAGASAGGLAQGDIKQGLGG